MWVVIKFVGNSMIGCVVGPFDSPFAAQDYADKAIVGGLGHEAWVVRELQEAADL